MELLRLFADNLLPVFLIVGTGWLLVARLRTDPRPVGQVSLNVLAPALLVDLLLRSDASAADMARMMSFAIASLLLPTLVALLVARFFGWSRGITSAVVLTVMLPNAGNYGLAVNLFAFGNAGLANASLYFIAAWVLSFSVGVFVASMGRSSVRGALGVLVRTPTLWAVGAACLLRSLHVPLPGPVTSAVHLLAQACVPVFLLVLGMQFHGAHLRGPVPAVSFAVGMRLVGGAAAGMLLAPAFHLAGVARQSGVLESGMPTAIVAALLAREHEAEPDVVLSVVLMTTLLSPLTLTPLLSILHAGR